MSLFFDLGDTLVDLRTLGPAMAEELRRRGVDPVVAREVGTEWITRTARATAEAADRYVPGVGIAGAAVRDALAVRGIDVPPAAAVRLATDSWTRYLRGARFHADVTPALLREFRRRVARMGVVTDSDRAIVEPLLERLRIRELFDVIVVSESVRAYKPNPRIFLAALGRGRPEDSLFVSNSRLDLEGAAAVGMRVVWVRRGRGPAGDRLAGAHVVRDLRQLPRLLDRLARRGPGPEAETPAPRGKRGRRGGA